MNIMKLILMNIMNNKQCVQDTKQNHCVSWIPDTKIAQKNVSLATHLSLGNGTHAAIVIKQLQYQNSIDIMQLMVVLDSYCINIALLQCSYWRIRSVNESDGTFLISTDISVYSMSEYEFKNTAIYTINNFVASVKLCNFQQRRVLLATLVVQSGTRNFPQCRVVLATRRRVKWSPSQRVDLTPHRRRELSSQLAVVESCLPNSP